MSSETPLSTLLRLTDAFLSGNGFQKTASQLQKEAKKRGITLNEDTPQETLPALDSVFAHWQSTHILQESEGSASDDESSVLSSDSGLEDSSDSSSDEDSSSSSDSESEEEEVDTSTQRGVKRKRGAPSPASSASSSDASSSSSSESDSDSDSDSSSDSDAEAVPHLKSVPVKIAETDSSSSSDDDSDSASDSSSSDSSDSSSDSSSDDEAPQTSLTTPLTESRASSNSSGTISGTLVPSPKAKSKRALTSDNEDSSVLQSASDSASGRPLKKTKITNEPFSRIPKDQLVDPKLASNKFVPYDYAQRAHEKLIVTKGKGFTKEKNKGKRGSYRGGKIDFTPKGIKFED